MKKRAIKEVHKMMTGEKGRYFPAYHLRRDGSVAVGGGGGPLAASSSR
jgi:hypothetical protein